MTSSITTNKDFKVKNGLSVAGNATFDSQVILGTTPLAFDTNTNRLQIQINNVWTDVAFLGDIPDSTNQLNFMDIGLAIDYNGLPTYIIQGNGVNPSGTSKFLDGGNPSTTSTDFVFDSGVITV
jgi:hypothetical protein